MRLEITDVRTLSDDTPDVRDLEFLNQPVTLGSGSGTLVRLPDLAIAEHHATLSPLDDDSWIYQPTTRDDQTRINGEPVTGEATLKDGDRIEITRFEIKIMIDRTSDVAPVVGGAGGLSKITKYPLPPRSEIRKADVTVSLDLVRQDALATVADKISQHSGIVDLLERVVESLQTSLGARTVWLGLQRTPYGELDVIDSCTDDGKLHVDVTQLEGFIYRCLERGQFIRIPKTDDDQTQSIMAIPLTNKDGAFGLLYADSRKRTRLFDRADLDFFTTVGRLIAPILDRVMKEKPTAASDTTFAGNFIHASQATLRVPDGASWKKLDVAAYHRPSDEGSGDLYDAMKLPKGLAAFMVGSVSAPTPARTALAISEIRSAFKIAGLHADPAHVQLKSIHWMLLDDPEPYTFDGIILITNLKTGAAEYCTAGAVGALIIDAKGTPRKLSGANSRSVNKLDTTDYTPTSARIGDGETLVFYTRGCATMQNSNGKALGESKFVEAVCDVFGQPATAALDDVIADFSPYLVDGSQPHDVTILMVHRT